MAKKYNYSKSSYSSNRGNKSGSELKNYEKYNVSSGGFSSPYYKSKGFSVTAETSGDGLRDPIASTFASSQAQYQRWHESEESRKAARWLESENRRKRSHDLVMNWGPLGLLLDKSLNVTDFIRTMFSRIR